MHVLFCFLKKAKYRIPVLGEVWKFEGEEGGLIFKSEFKVGEKCEIDFFYSLSVSTYGFC